MAQVAAADVDPALLDYGSATANSLRDAQAALRGAASQTRVREVNAPPQYRYYARYGTVDVMNDNDFPVTGAGARRRAA